MVSIPIITSIDERPRLEEAVILDADDMNVLFFPLLGADALKTTEKKSENDSKVNTPPSVKEGLSYPGVRPIFSEFPKPTNHIQTVLQPTLVNPPVLQPSLAMPNLVRLAPPAVEAKFKVPDASTPQARQPSDPLTRLDAALSQPTRPLPAPVAEAKFKMPDSANPAARPVVPVPVAQDVSLSGPLRPLAAPVAEPRFKLPDSVNPAARPVVPVTVAQDVSLSGPLRPLAAPVAEPRFKVPDSVNPAARPVAARDCRSSGCFSVRPDSPLGRACRGTSVQAAGSCCAGRSTGANRARRRDTGAVIRTCTAVGRTCCGIQAQGSRLRHTGPANDSIRGYYESGPWDGACTAARCSDCGVQIQSARLRHTGPANDGIRGDYESGSWDRTCTAARCSDRGIQIQSARLRHTGPANDSIRGDYESRSWDRTCPAARCSDCGIQAEGTRFGCCVSAAKFAADHRTNERPANWTNTNTAISGAYCRIQTEDTGRGYACCSSRHARNCPSGQSPFGTCDNAGTTCAAAARGLCIQAQ